MTQIANDNELIEPMHGCGCTHVRLEKRGAASVYVRALCEGRYSVHDGSRSVIGTNVGLAAGTKVASTCSNNRLCLANSNTFLGERFRTCIRLLSQP